MPELRWYQHPRTLYRISALECCERFSFFGMRTMLVLVLIGAPATGGFGWDPGRALRLLGAFVALVYLAPVIGGYIVDRYIGARRSLSLGLVVLCVGHMLALAPWMLPSLAGVLTGYPIGAIVYAEGGRLGDWSVSAATLQAIEQSVRELVVGHQAQEAAINTALGVYRGITGSFYAAMMLIVVGTGLYRPASSTIVASLCSSDARREAAFTIFYATINIGVFAAPVLAGGIGETRGWQLGFGITASAAALAVAGLWAWRTSFVIGTAMPSASRDMLPTRWSDRPQQERRDLLLLMVLLVFTALWMAAAELSSGYLTVYIVRDLDRTISGFTVPVTWLQAISPLMVVAISLPMTSLWSRLETQDRNPSVLTKFILSALIMGVAFIPMMMLADANARSPVDGAIVVSVIVFFFFIFVLSELLVGPILFAAVGKLAPPDVLSVAMGGIYLSWAVGSWLAGEVGAAALDLSVSRFFGSVTLCMGFLALAVWVVAKRITSLPLVYGSAAKAP